MLSEFDFEDQTGIYPEYEKIFRDVYDFCLAKTCKPLYYILSLAIIDGEKSRMINREYRQKDYIADVITFAYLDDKNEKPNDTFVDLGEIMLCPPAIKLRAEEIGNDFKEEMIYLFIHGFLHIIGYDHVDDEEKAEKMFAKQDELFQEYMRRKKYE